ncbi:zinc finger protein CONSTANS-LIKE 16-like [Zingiber officinale]|uniref:CCT domain-containing protein n=1 Tax=Zingiber officinale TaxID=94328 RepID=A0A8J5L5E9_ZINOF|nr:zinc finger protein CONSTANS-LIKE 16-like [Zingiber officinale]KAG6501355.1 hypothetical protein ZIOFF_041234 [Zingiber officinale]
MGAVATRTACACGCEADDAFLCHARDVSVHSTNPLDCSHCRIRISTASSSPSSSLHIWEDDDLHEQGNPEWLHLHGFMCKPRTLRRGRKPSNRTAKEEGNLNVVPGFEEDDMSAEENLQSTKVVQQQRMIHCVPIFDPAVLVEFFSQLHPQLEAIEENDSSRAEVQVVKHDQMASMGRLDYCLDLEKLEPDMETLLGVGCDGYAKKDEYRASADGPGETTRRMLLRLDYDAVSDAWSSSNIGCSPWTDGERPQFEDTWRDFFAVRYQVNGRGDHEGAGGVYRLDRGVVGVEGREARVWRYREKRRTRLFSKKIRYEVRKRNAEKRPRMKGRFVGVQK